MTSKSCSQPRAAAGQAQEAPHSSPSFPAGLIPKLVEHRSRTEPPYSPLSPLDLEAVSFQPSPQPSPYILSRLDKFVADLQVPGRGPGLGVQGLGSIGPDKGGFALEALEGPGAGQWPAWQWGLGILLFDPFLMLLHLYVFSKGFNGLGDSKCWRGSAGVPVWPVQCGVTVTGTAHGRGDGQAAACSFPWLRRELLGRQLEPSRLPKAGHLILQD